jgi:SAM-dependent methyltransferase
VLQELASAPFYRFIRPLYKKLRTSGYEVIDRILNVTTTNERIANRLCIEDFYPFGALGWASCWRVLRWLPRGPNEVFLDIGCGAGRMTCAAARRYFGRVIGLEISPALTEIARTNIANLQGRVSPCEIICADAQEYRVPNDVTVVFMYNPFTSRVLRSTLDNLVESHDRNPRRIVLAYANPIEHTIVLSDPRFRPFRRLHLSWRPSSNWKRTQAVQLYELLPMK